MFLHVLTLRWKPEATATDTAGALESIKALSGRTPGLTRAIVGDVAPARAGGYSTIVTLEFVDQPSFAAFAAGRAHREFAAAYGSLLDMLVFDADRPWDSADG